MSVLYLVDGDKARVLKGKSREEVKRRLWFLTRDPDFTTRSDARKRTSSYEALGRTTP